MSNGVHVSLKDGKGTNSHAKITKRGQVITSPLEFSEMYPAVALINNVPVNVVSPITGKRFIITDIILYANKSVGVLDATVNLYEANEEVSTIVSKQIFSQEMLKQTSLPLIGLNIIVTEGKWLTLVTDDNTIFANIGGYYVDA